jgi:hypothetical protein
VGLGPALILVDGALSYRASGPKGAALRPAGPVCCAPPSRARRLIGPTESEARALMVHCAREMAYLATFLPAFYAQEG